MYRVAHLNSSPVKLPELLSVVAYGAVGDDTGDDAPSIQAAVDAATVGDVVFFPHGSYTAGSTITVPYGIFLIGDGFGDEGVEKSFQSGTRTRIRWVGGVGQGPIIHFKSATPGNQIHGGGISGLWLEGSNTAQRGIQLTSCRNTLVEAGVKSCTESMLRIDDENGVLSSQVRVPFFKGNIGPNIATAGCHGIDIEGNRAGGSDGCTNVFGGNWTLEYQDGNAVRFRDVDSCVIQKVHCVERPGSTAKAVVFRSSSILNAGITQKNIILALARGDVEYEADTLGNRVISMHSEGGSVYNPSKVPAHWDVIDFKHGDLFQTHRYTMSDQWPVPLGFGVPIVGAPEFKSSGGGNAGPCVAFDTLAPETWGVIARPPHNWNNGKIVGARLIVSKPGTSFVQGHADIKVEVGASPADGSANVAVVHESASGLFDIPIDNLRATGIDLSFSTPVTFSRDDTIAVRVTRTPANETDKLHVDLLVYSCELLYENDGPDGQAGTWEIGKNQIA